MTAIVRKDRRSQGRKEGFTLIEVLLTLAILVMLGSLVFVRFDSLFGTQRLRAAVDRVRAEWVALRVEAMRSDCPYMFRFAPSGRDFRTDVVPVMEPVVDLSTGMPTSATALGPQYTGLPLLSELLPETISFYDVTFDNDTRQAYIALPSDSVSPTTEGVTSWSDPIMFYPDGTTTTVELTLATSRGMAVKLSLRGLTGTVKISDPYPMQKSAP
jgi:prepilin-type N-terminal cleavage/methylation domain-containing protein